MIYVMALVVFILAVLGMSLGLLRGRCLRGTCGGLNQMRDSSGRSACEACHSMDDHGRPAESDDISDDDSRMHDQSDELRNATHRESNTHRV